MKKKRKIHASPVDLIVEARNKSYRVKLGLFTLNGIAAIFLAAKKHDISKKKLAGPK